MKNFYLLLACSVLFFACEEDGVSPGLIGLWQLTEVLADPGDGSGVFMPTDLDQTIAFFNDGSFKASGTFCRSSLALMIQSTGTYDTARNVILTDDCALNDIQLEYPFEIDENGNLIVNFVCIEACANKYQKVFKE